MDISPTTRTYGPGAGQGFIVKPSDITEVGCTLDLAAVAAVDGAIPAGTPLGGPTAAGTYGDYNNAATNGTEVFAGVLFDSIPTRGKTTGNVGASRIVLGAVYEAKLPKPIDAAAKADVPTIAFV